jgi:hypothetical protein
VSDEKLSDIMLVNVGAATGPYWVKLDQLRKLLATQGFHVVRQQPALTDEELQARIRDGVSFECPCGVTYATNRCPACEQDQPGLRLVRESELLPAPFTVRMVREQGWELVQPGSKAVLEAGNLVLDSSLRRIADENGGCLADWARAELARREKSDPKRG